jgi:hypothetical protein
LEENYRPDVCARPRLPRGRGFTRGQVFTVCRRSKNRVRADALAFARTRARPRGRGKKIKKIKKYLSFKKKFFLVVVAGLERENFFSILNFKF